VLRQSGRNVAANDARPYHPANWSRDMTNETDAPCGVPEQPANLTCRKGVWYYRTQVDGRDQRRTLKIGDLEKAKFRLAAMLRKINPPAPMTPQGRQSFVYFIGGENGPVKIGTTGDPGGRLDMMQIGSPVPLKMLALVPGNEATERRYHRQFEASRLHGEWFERTTEMLTEIATASNLLAEVTALDPIYSPTHRGEKL
jgi:hypothetical protein